MAPLTANPTLTTVAGFQTVVPKNGTNTLTAFGEGLSFDGRYVGFWGGWGTDTFAEAGRVRDRRQRHRPPGLSRPGQQRHGQ